MKRKTDRGRLVLVLCGLKIASGWCGRTTWKVYKPGDELKDLALAIQHLDESAHGYRDQINSGVQETACCNNCSVRGGIVVCLSVGSEPEGSGIGPH
ncbi:hypothetical protein EVAR_31381_1 [Eumeta japonica]|uniref:Uncharacterized protein n=1 Tax=Eumeta variegata TaxID=151549 RepID=A0A4C1XAK8_EUMVA|nr:hypothetical protein EVAR_31381_1 [Eumeta japonica]